VRLVSLCAVGDLPADGGLRSFEVEGREICVANDGGRYAAVDNVCPHRGGPLAEGSIEDGCVLCPWHAWAFSLASGAASHDGAQTVEVFPLEIQGSDVKVALGE
jgi:nitrite reductase (NADH) small subunit